MKSKVWKLDNGSVIVVEVRPHQDVPAEVQAVAEAVDALIKDDDATYYRVTDFSAVDISFSDVVAGLGKEASGTPGTLGDPRLVPVIVGTADMVTLVAESAGQAQYGGIDILLFETREDALEHIREELL